MLHNMIKKVGIYVAVPMVWVLVMCISAFSGDEAAMVAYAENTSYTSTETTTDTGTSTSTSTSTTTDTGITSGTGSTPESSITNVQNQIMPQVVPENEPIAAPIYVWIPQTPDEIERAAYGSGGLIGYGAGPNIRIFCEIQGPECVKTMKSAMKDGYQIAYTYSIIYYDDARPGEWIYETEESYDIELVVPEKIIKEGRQFEMICVSKDGKTYTVPVEIGEDNKLLFSVNRFYAYALVYKD